MKKVTILLIFGMGIGAFCYAQTAKWHWWACGVDKIGNGQYISTYTTGKEVIVCDEVFDSSYLEGYAHGDVHSAAVSCVLVK